MRAHKFKIEKVCKISGIVNDEESKNAPYDKRIFPNAICD